MYGTYEDPQPKYPEWTGVVDHLGHLICLKCRAMGLGNRFVDYVYGAPHSEEACDYCLQKVGNQDHERGA